jgi:hypothetical protein
MGRRDVLPRRGFCLRGAMAGRFSGGSVPALEMTVNDARGLGRHKHHQGQRREFAEQRPQGFLFLAHYGVWRLIVHAKPARPG